MQPDLCGVPGAEPRDAESPDVLMLLEHGCRDAAAKCIRRNMRIHVMLEVKKLASEWASGCRGQYADMFDAIARALMQERIRRNGNPTLKSGTTQAGLVGTAQAAGQTQVNRPQAPAAKRT